MKEYYKIAGESGFPETFFKKLIKDKNIYDNIINISNN